MTKEENVAAMNKRYESLDEIFNDSEVHLILEQKKEKAVRTADDRLLANFEEINDFIEKTGSEPKANLNNVSEYQLYARLKALRGNPENAALLASRDIYNLLPREVSNLLSEPNEPYGKITSLDDILEDDLFETLKEEDAGLFDFKNIPRETERASADFVARRKPCKDFDKYEALLKDVQAELAAGKRKLVDFNMGNLRKGAFYVHNGVLFLLEKVNITQSEHYKEDGTRVREDGRTRCIFENGTESNMLKRSVEKILYANGKVVTENFEHVNADFEATFGSITEEDKEAGYIYVLRSKSREPKIQNIKDLFKIGYSTSEVPDRIKNAAKEPTYLMAPVEYVTGWKCYNMNPQKFEQLIHNFFGSSCLEIDVFDENDKRHTPREWFIAPLEVIEQAVELIINGKVVNYKFDKATGLIVKR